MRKGLVSFAGKRLVRPFALALCLLTALPVLAQQTGGAAPPASGVLYWPRMGAEPLPDPAPAQGAPRASLLSFDDLSGWAADDHLAALSTFLGTCGDLREADWLAICRLARATAQAASKNVSADSTPTGARAFFEMAFAPVLLSDGAPALFTGYYEPELAGARHRDARFRFPLYRVPPELERGTPWLTRAQIEQDGVLEGRGLELAWVEDPVALMFLQIQGSGRIRLRDGSLLRLGYGGHNGHPYRSIGQEMVRRGIYAPHQVSAAVIGNWVRRNPQAGASLLHSNPSYVFFREITGMAPGAGPRGAMNRSLTAGRSLAVDPRHTPLGAPVWIEKEGDQAMHRLMVAQDTGSAIRGAQRGDVFVGSGPAAGKIAARMRDAGRMVVLLPLQRAHALVDGALL